jgi:hypothetical protein
LDDEMGLVLERPKEREHQQWGGEWVLSRDGGLDRESVQL